MEQTDVNIRKITRKYFKGDRVIWGVILALSLFSLLAVYSSTGTLAYKYQSGNTLYYFIKHFSFLLFGIAVVFFAHLVPHRYYSRLAQLLYYVSIPLLVLTLIMGTNLNEASRWLTLPGVGISFQTSDLAKLALIMYLARLLSQKQDQIKDFKEAFRPLMIPIIITCGLILPANFSTAAILFVTSLTILFFGRINIKYLLSLIGIGGIAFAFFVLIVFSLPEELQDSFRVGTWKSRIESFVNSSDEDNYQAEQAKIAIATGGITGKLPGNSTQRNFLPHPYSDFIFAIIVEEYGLLGAVVVVLLYLILLYRAGVIVKKTNSQFGAFVAIGLTFSLVFQAMINMAVAVNLFPVTGQTLPFISMGGTSILFTSTALGIILSVSRAEENTEENEEPAKE
ncbi:MAG: cell division protein FtsW [Marinilabiliales bacterium]|nr:MAG: cell division protein FtsW [Marinilabiliales bacterium]